MKHFNVIHLLFVFLVASCSSSSKKQEIDSSINDSIINAQLKTIIDTTLLHSYINLQVEQLSIANSYTDSDTIKCVTGKGRSSRYNRYGNETFEISGSYSVNHNMLSCKSLKVSHSNVGTVFAIFEKYDTLLTYCMDSVTFFKKNHDHVEKQYELWQDRTYKVEYAYANRTKVHFGMSKYEYDKYGADLKRNFYEGLVGSGAYELAEPIFSRENKFVGFEIMELHGKTFNYDNIYNANLVKEEQLGYDAHECFRKVFLCELYNMEFISRYDKFERRTKHSLKCYWNEYIRIYDRF